MKENEKNHVLELLDHEGFDYGLKEYDFKEVKDKKFHELREAYIKAANTLENYINQ